jgi:histidinol dehydrogenase
LEIVTPLIQDIKSNSLAAVLAQAERFDGVRPEHVRVPQSQLDRALSELAPDLRAAIQTAIERVRKVSEAAVPEGFDLDLAQGAVVSQRYVPVDSVGLYVPGGKAVYPSSVVMNAVAAQAAGVPRIAIASPPQKEFGGLPHPAILATAALLGVTEVYAIGGAAAVAAFGYGIKEIDLAPVRMVTGPGNIYVAAAKRALRGLIGIDSEAGPTEILIIADKSANPASVAADLISQAEHDENAAAVLVTDSRELIAAVQRELDIQVANTSNLDRVKVALAGIQSALVLVPDLEIAVAVSNEYATEHLEIQTADPQALLPKITNAGAIFLGRHTPEAMGDYIAGPNHVLPTSRTARFSSGLSVLDFMKRTTLLGLDAKSMAAIGPDALVLAEAEGLEAHARSIAARLNQKS